MDDDPSRLSCAGTRSHAMPANPRLPASYQPIAPDAARREALVRR
ncbi:hypothetical protein BLA39750_02510 [Burkholderia lata]|uniref:Uncharacterized protein n=1 Tax=Burkholderia lata (strain ATCC 17760 / DSM 23089 / LMG 22485 / NCIMB 9086 / R18194 / 383) TaxID=482957 RepID=A0A6P2WU34_BURL3|nr:hypothetical protein BLA39750_02510 [Burkholderia lata]